MNKLAFLDYAITDALKMKSMIAARVATVLFLIVGTFLLPDEPEERASVDAFMDRISGSR